MRCSCADFSAGSQASQGSGSTGLWPNVAIYLDNQSGQLPNRNLDIYAADLNRIEVLEGPQGTLFGAGAEAGVIRYITNEPKLDVTEGNVKGGYGDTAHGDPNTDVTAVLNLPLIADTMAVRGGDLRRPPRRLHRQRSGTFTRKNTDIGIHYADFPAVERRVPGRPARTTGYCVPPGSPRSTTTPRRQRHQSGDLPGHPRRAALQVQRRLGRAAHAVLPGHELAGRVLPAADASDGAPLAPLEVTLFNTAYDKDRFENTA